MSSTTRIEYDLKAFMRRVKKRLDFDAFYLIPDTNHVHMLLVVYNGNIKHFNRKAEKRPCCWNIKVNEFNSSLDEYLENKVKYLMKKRNMNPQDDWATPPRFLESLDKVYKFDFDPCPWMHDTEEWDGLKIEWGTCNFINPPYSRKLKEVRWDGCPDRAVPARGWRDHR